MKPFYFIPFGTKRLQTALEAGGGAMSNKTLIHYIAELLLNNLFFWPLDSTGVAFWTERSGSLFRAHSHISNELRRGILRRLLQVSAGGPQRMSGSDGGPKTARSSEGGPQGAGSGGGRLASLEPRRLRRGVASGLLEQSEAACARAQAWEQWWPGGPKSAAAAARCGQARCLGAPRWRY